MVCRGILQSRDRGGLPVPATCLIVIVMGNIGKKTYRYLSIHIDIFGIDIDNIDIHQ